MTWEALRALPEEVYQVQIDRLIAAGALERVTEPVTDGCNREVHR
jgi:hypothetical protein